MPNATNTVAGDIQLAGDLAGNNDATAPALTSTGVAPGSYLNANVTVDSKGRITAASAASFPDATTSSKGIVQIGTNISVTAGVISVVDATTGVKGVVQVGSGLAVTAGVISLDAPDATTGSKGVVQIGTNIDVTAGVISVATATTSVKGVVQVGTNINVSSGTISIPDATGASKGVMQVGSGLSVTGGVVSVPDATGISKGVVQIGSGLSVTAGVVSLDAPDATTGSKGIVQVGSGLSVTAGVLSTTSTADATTSTKGIVQIGANIAVAAGVISTGANVPLLDATNTFTKAQKVTTSALTSGTNISVNASLSNVYTLTIAHNATLDNPSSLGAGRYTFIITQDGTGSRTLAFGSAYKFASGADTAISSGAGTVSVLTAVSNGTNLYCSLAKNFV